MRAFVGLIGAKGAGKSTFASLAKMLFPSLVTEMALADKLKDVCSKVVGWRRENFDLQDKKERYHRGSLTEPLSLTHDQIATVVDAYGFSPTHKLVEPHVGKVLYTPRQLAQYVGTEILRELDPDVHCKALLAGAPEKGIVLVTDVRFPNELRFFQQFGSDFYPTYVRNFKTELLAAKDSHASEQHLTTISAGATTVDNTGSVGDLEGKVYKYLSEILAKYDGPNP